MGPSSRLTPAIRTTTDGQCGAVGLNTTDHAFVHACEWLACPVDSLSPVSLEADGSGRARPSSAEIE
jgi:hypothetical protein